VTVEVTEFKTPFRHWLVRGAVPPEVAAVRGGLPAAGWIRYDNELERGKWAIEDRRWLGAGWRDLLSHLESLDLSFTGIPGIRPDPDRRGAGLHLMLPGGWLQTHLDYALHPCGLERRANLIYFPDRIDPGFGGGLQLCDPLGVPVKTLYPDDGEAVVWECGDETYHAVEPLAADGPPRVTAAAYYLAAPRPNCTRRRALFLPRR
jgi:hypothetical protein